MTGTLLATILSPLVTLALGGALLAYFRTKEQQEAPKTRRGRAADFVTRDELEEILEKYSKQWEFENTEWYDKFNALHQRLAKRDKRRNAPEVEPADPEGGSQSQPVSAIHLRRLGSL